MPRPTGLRKTGGRKAGTPNVRTQALNEIFENLSLNVPERIVEILPLLDPEKQVDVLLRLMNYLYPKRKEIEFVEDSSTAPTLIIIPHNGRDKINDLASGTT